MCWSFEVSVGFAVAETVLLAIMLTFRKTRRYYHFAPILVTVIIVEVAEAFIWKAGVPSLTQRFAFDLTCPALNSAMTTLIMFTVMTQPILFAHYVYTTMKRGKTSPDLHFHLDFFIMFLAVWNYLTLCLRYIVTQSDPKGALYIVPYALLDDVFNNTFSEALSSYDYGLSCSYEGDSGHLYWQWAIGSIANGFYTNPSFIYGLSMLTFVLIPDKYEAIFLVSFGLTAFITAFIWSIPEAGSMWCWSGFVLHIFYVIYPTFLADRLPKLHFWSEVMPCFLPLAKYSNLCFDRAKESLSTEIV